MTDLIGANKVAEKIYVGNVLSDSSQAAIILGVENAGPDIVLLSNIVGWCNAFSVDLSGTGEASCLEHDTMCLSSCMKAVQDGLGICIVQCLGYHGGFPSTGD